MSIWIILITKNKDQINFIAKFLINIKIFKHIIQIIKNKSQKSINKQKNLNKRKRLIKN